jgi:hypothetical protein
MSQLSRRAFIATGLGAFATLLASAAVARARECARSERADTPHPDPRPGITGARVATAEQRTCQAQGRRASRLEKSGKSLDDIGAAIDRKFT